MEGGKAVLRDSFSLVWLEEQHGPGRTDFHKSGGEEKGRMDVGPKWAELKGWTEASRRKGSKMKQVC